MQPLTLLCATSLKWMSALALGFASLGKMPAQQDVPASGVPAKPEARAAGVPAKHAGKKVPPAVVAAKKADKNDKPEQTAYNFSLPGADGKDVPLTNFKGKYLVVVNLARKSMYADQLAGLVKLSETYKAKDVVVLGVPSNDFGAGEPGTGAEIQKAYTDAKVTFPVMAVSKVSGDAGLPLFGYLTKGKTAPPGGPVHWNYTKFVIDKKGNVVARLDPDVAPDSPEMLSTLDQVLAGTFKPKKGAAKPDTEGPPDDDEE